jgi:hypothetical protein
MFRDRLKQTPMTKANLDYPAVLFLSKCLLKDSHAIQTSTILQSNHGGCLARGSGSHSPFF